MNKLRKEEIKGNRAVIPRLRTQILSVKTYMTILVSLLF